MVTLPDGTAAYLPAWMMKPEAAQFALVEEPLVSLNALRNLLRIVDTGVSFLHHGENTDCGGGSDAGTERTGAICREDGLERCCFKSGEDTADTSSERSRHRAMGNTQEAKFEGGGGR